MSLWWVAVWWLGTGLLLALNASLIPTPQVPKWVRPFLWPCFVAMGPIPMYMMVLGSILEHRK